MVNSFFFTIITIIFITNWNSKASLCTYFFFHIYIFIITKDYVDQIGSNNANGSQSSPYPNISTAIKQNPNRFLELSLILIASSTPYNFSSSDLWPNLNLTLLLFLYIYIFLEYWIFFFRTQNSKSNASCFFPKWYFIAKLKKQQLNITQY